MKTITRRDRIAIEDVSLILPELLAWVDGDPETRWDLRQDFAAMYRACEQIQRQKAACGSFDEARLAAFPELENGVPM
ncbi:MAG TPA: hypothetical protein VMT30_09330 [Candidatus Saccharimonadia bacterium]|nr:hypothetical protein [Candidatus Saccharimonadia bacterium]